MSEEEKTVEVALIDSVARSNIKDIAVDLAEVGLDAVTKNELIAAIPVFGNIARILGAGVSIRDRLFLKKIASFLNELQSVSQEKRIKFVRELEEDSGTRAKAGAALMMLIDRLDDLDKPPIIGRLYKARIENRITGDELRRFSMIVDRAHFPDLVYISGVNDEEKLKGDALPYLAALGLVSEAEQDYNTFSSIDPGTYYSINALGRKFVSAAFGK
ncbi:hypothetical protein HH303_09695 [Rhodospirillaceae bacterium KN72]|uniref:DUF4393 domain-containing protein n=1 Tax=Pacificispira spongiicola TaxID=2729598 RepID=A0A7Y0HED6_9PROT|nr:hypothetical protein [Pacificispira spongiicola]NMM44751.1 hypothetical protein [Pacificispira spongiicola]